MPKPSMLKNSSDDLKPKSGGMSIPMVLVQK